MSTYYTARNTEMAALGKHYCHPTLQYYPTDSGALPINLDPLPFRIGRHRKANFIIPSQQISKEHAEISQCGEVFQIRDLRSTNGTFVNGQPITESPLQNNDIVHLAHEEFRFVTAFDGESSGNEHFPTELVHGNVPTSVYMGTKCLEEMLSQKMVRILFQPIVDLNSGELLGYEALARGTHAALSIKPAVLFALAQRCGMASDLSRMFLREAVRESQRLHGSGFLFLNLHHSEMANGDLIQFLDAVRREMSTGWKPVLEINENAVVDLPTWRHLLEQLKGLGMRVAYDDFGMGQSRVLELAELPPDFIKLDMKLVRNVHQVESRQKIIEALTHVSRKLGVQVIAEGIEYQKEADICRQMGCQFGQGFLFAPPQGPPAAAPHYGALIAEFSGTVSDRRAAARMPGFGMALVRQDGPGAAQFPAQAAKIVDFSQTGIAFRLSQQVAQGTLLELAPFGWTGSRTVLNARVVHARRTEDCWLLGCQFVNRLSNIDLERLSGQHISCLSLRAPAGS
jgi:EAL domain-containing protein (putative c-di-GMP-specific phosphodiesterase class I)